MSRPKTLRVGPYVWTVLWQRRDVLRFHPDGSACGCCDAPTLTIAVDGSGAEDYSRATLLHELLHACLRCSDPHLDDDAEETAVAGITGPLLAALKDNPGLVTYLVGER
jgi:hypothetical protein